MYKALEKKRRDGGFTLVELLITIVIIGVLAAVVVLAIGGLTNTGSKSACTATKDAANAAATAYYSDHNATWPADFAAMSSYMTPRDGTTVNAGTITGTGWTLTFVAGTPPTYTGC